MSHGAGIYFPDFLSLQALHVAHFDRISTVHSPGYAVAADKGTLSKGKPLMYLFNGQRTRHNLYPIRCAR
jgi:hypothetical protein